MQPLFGAAGKWVVLAVFAGAFGLILGRVLRPHFTALGAAALLLLAGLVTPAEAVGRMIRWDALGLTFGFGLLAVALRESGSPRLVASRALRRLRSEGQILLFLYGLAALLSVALPNPVVVLLLGPLVFDLSERFGSSPFRGLIGVAVASNAVTTVSMVADLPAMILAVETGMTFLDFYWYRGRAGLGVLSLAAIAVAFGVFALQVRGLRTAAGWRREALRAKRAPLLVFALGVLALVFPPLARSPGLVGLAVGAASLALMSDRIPRTLLETDWASMLFLAGIFVVTGALEKHGFLRDLAGLIVRLGLTRPIVLVSLVTWLSVALSSFVDNVPYTVLMIPACLSLAGEVGMAPEPLLYGMLVGTGIGGNITPVGATANVLACGMLEKRGVGVRLREYLAVSLPFTLVAVTAAQLLILLLWV